MGFESNIKTDNADDALSGVVGSNELEIIKKTLEHVHSLTQNPEEYELSAKELIKKVYDALEHQGIDLVPFNNIWGEVKNKGLLVRRDDPERILNAILDGKKIILKSNGDNYANASVDTEEGLRTALGEGLLGVEMNMAYGFNPKGLTVSEVKRGDGDLRQASRFTHVRSASGTITPEDIKYLVVRVPTKLFPQEKLTGEEQELIDDGTPPPYIIRATKLSLADEEENGKTLH